MREHLFRGFHPDKNGNVKIKFNGRNVTGKWVEGDYAHPNNICFEEIGYDETLKQDKVPIWNDCNVLPETVCEYTGHSDLRGNKIFEGDIVQLAGEDEFFAVEWDHETARYVFEGDGWLCDFDNYYDSDILVVGNVYENPEFLEGQNG